MPNLKRQITKHSQKVLRDNDKNSNNKERTCNCKNKDECSVNGRCVTTGVIYKATVKHNKDMPFIDTSSKNTSE